MTNHSLNNDRITTGKFRRNIIFRLLARFRAWQNRKAAIRQLQQMPDRLLKDIGIERGDIVSAVSKVEVEVASAAFTATVPVKSMPSQPEALKRVA